MAPAWPVLARLKNGLDYEHEGHFRECLGPLLSASPHAAVHYLTADGTSQARSFRFIRTSVNLRQLSESRDEVSYDRLVGEG